MYVRTALLTLLTLSLSGLFASTPAQDRASPPKTTTVDSVDVYHGTRVPAPYRWLEEIDSEDTRQWVEEQNAYTTRHLRQIPEREQIGNRLRALWDYPKYGVPQQKGGYRYHSKNAGLQNHAVVYVQPTNSDEEPRVLFNPNEWSEDGTVSLSAFAPGPNGNYVAYGKSKGGSDWKTLYVRNVNTQETMADTLRWVKFSNPTWTTDGEGFYYGRYPEPKEGEEYEDETKAQKIYYHEVGTPQSEDRLVYQRPDNPKLGFGTDVTHDGRYLIISASEGTSEKTELYVKDLTEADAEIRPLITGFDASYDVIGVEEQTLYVQTNLDAPNRRVVAIDLASPDQSNWRTVIPESDAVLQSVELAGGKLVVQRLKDVKGRLAIYSLEGRQQTQVELPTIGTVGSVSGDPDRSSFYYGFTSFTYPTTVFKYDLDTGTSETIYEAEVPGFEADRYAVNQVFYESTDGTEIPMFLVHKKGLEQNGTHPTRLYGYGGFNITITPSFSPKTLAWLEMGGIYAVPNLRGGGAYGQSWHEAGKLENKQQVFDDFASAALYLIDENYTSRSKLAISGASNGGLLTGASVTQRPNLFGAAVVERGVLDMLRYDEFTIGWAWVPEYGSSDDPEQFEYLYAYSPLHNVEPGTAYPPTMITTADTDDRVVPSHSYKFAAAMQDAQAGDAPILLRVETDTGHGGGTPTSKEIEETTDVFAFLVDALKMEVPAFSSSGTPSSE
ncbi:prolyl oligopeptidase family serine peptidase [Salinibacter sp. 10B]|uniref:prolyl oligopeptidase family serine peptidase n=1 Tax=Salinibacter sp. 10B TaxID=1923971 RepID=UPI000CF4ABCC|nr:prolyl oligopeptidase family serine peptidase [Salinibacter sp. 10B]